MRTRILILLMLFWIGGGLIACSAPIEDEQPDKGIALQSLEDMDEDQAWQLYSWYLEQGWAPCDPPPDPWHPFAIYQFCGEDVHHEKVPQQSWDE